MFVCDVSVYLSTSFVQSVSVCQQLEYNHIHGQICCFQKFEQRRTENTATLNIKCNFLFGFPFVVQRAVRCEHTAHSGRGPFRVFNLESGRVSCSFSLKPALKDSLNSSDAF